MASNKSAIKITRILFFCEELNKRVNRERHSRANARHSLSRETLVCACECPLAHTSALALAHALPRTHHTCSDAIGILPALAHGELPRARGERERACAR